MVNSPNPNPSPELKPCPFCGAGTASSEYHLSGVWLEKSDHDEPDYHVHCWSCGGRGNERGDREAAIAAWNTRTLSPPPTITETVTVALPAPGEVELREALSAMTTWKNRLVGAFERSEVRVSELLAWKAEASAALATQPATSQEGEAVEALAQFLHDEGGFGDAMTDRTWPEHDGDTGQRGEGWVKIVPSDVAAHFRDVARRWLLSSTAPQSSADDILFLRKALTAIQDTPDQLSDLCTNVRMRNIAGFALLGQEW